MAHLALAYVVALGSKVLNDDFARAPRKTLLAIPVVALLLLGSSWFLTRSPNLYDIADISRYTSLTTQRIRPPKMTQAVEEALNSLGNLTQRRNYDTRGLATDWYDISSFYMVWGVLSYALADDESVRGSALWLMVSLFAVAVGDYQRLFLSTIWTLYLPYATFELASLVKLLFPAYAWIVLSITSWRHYSASNRLMAQLTELRQEDVPTPALLNKAGTNLEELLRSRKDNVMIGWFVRLVVFIVFSSAAQFLLARFSDKS